MEDSLHAHRLDGNQVSLGCMGCPLLGPCGGFTRRAGGWSCQSGCLNCDPSTCDKVCFNNAHFAKDYREVGGFDFAEIARLEQTRLRSTLPRFIPMIHNGSGRDRPLTVPWVAVPLLELLRKPNGQPRLNVSNRNELCQHFAISDKTNVLVSGINHDPEIEAYWKWQKVSRLPIGLADLDVRGAITPNYSFSLTHPRPQHLFNRKRTLLCADSWSRRGIPTIPVLQALTSTDFLYWTNFLHEHPEVEVVSQEFQTGLSSPGRGIPALRALASIQDELRRPLHLVAVGGYQYRKELRELFDTWTIVDSTPFIRAHKRRRAIRKGNRVIWTSARASSPDNLLQHNIEVAQALVDQDPVSRQPKMNHELTKKADRRQKSMFFS